MPAPQHWDPEGFNRIAGGLERRGVPRPIAEIAAEYAILDRPSNDPPTNETWVAASSTARLCATAVTAAFNAGATAEQVCGVLAGWEDSKFADPTELTAACVGAKR